jgi:hypothetical protein
MNVFRLAVASMYDLYRRYDLYRGIRYSVANATLNVISLGDEILVVEFPRVQNILQVHKMNLYQVGIVTVVAVGAVCMK